MTVVSDGIFQRKRYFCDYYFLGAMTLRLQLMLTLAQREPTLRPLMCTRSLNNNKETHMYM